MSGERQYKYTTVINYLMNYIQQHDLADGDRLPTEQQLSALLHVSRVSIQQGIKRLEKDGFVYRIQGSGTFVRRLADRKESSLMIPLVMDTRFNTVHGFDILRGAQETLFSHSCHLSPYYIKRDDPTYDPADFTRLIDDLVERGNRCLMVMQPDGVPPAFFRRHMRAGVQFVFLDTPLEDPLGCHTVYSDHRMGGYLITRHLIENGHRRIALFCPFSRDEWVHPNFLRRVEGYTQALQEAGIPLWEDLIFERCEPYARLQSCLDAMLALRQRPTAVFCLNDAVADRVTQELQRRGISFPDEISVAGFDNHDIACPVTTVQQDFYNEGRYAAELALRLLNEPAYPLTRQIVPVTLIKRATTGRCPRNG